MEAKFKIGDRVLVTKPKEGITNGLYWFQKMDKYDGKVFVVKHRNEVTKRYYCANDKVSLYLDESWLTKVEEAIAEDPKTEELKSIDWEQRRWDLASKLYAELEDVTLESAVNLSDIFIKYYKQTIK